MSPTPPTVTVDLDAIDALTAAAERYTAAHRGWINVSPEVDDADRPPPPSPIAALFRTHAYEIALGTWTPPDPKNPDAPQIIGLAHRLGARLVPLLDDFGLAAPPTWRRIQDSPRRGLVVAVPAATPHDEVLRWLMRLATAATRVPSTGRWVATLNEGRTPR